MGNRVPSEKMERVNVPLRLPRWIKEWLDATSAEGSERTRSWLIEDALRRAYRLKEPR